VWARNIRTSSLISSHESIIIWTFPLILSRVHHQSWTYPLMTISSISQTRTNTTSHAKRITNAPCHCIITWCSLNAARRNGCATRLAVPYHRRAPQHTRLPCFLPSPNGPLCIAKRYTSDVTLLVLGTLIQLLASNHSILTPKFLRKFIIIRQKYYNNAWHILQTIDLKLTIRPVKTKNSMLRTNYPNLSLIQWLTSQKNQF